MLIKRCASPMSRSLLALQATRTAQLLKSGDSDILVPPNPDPFDRTYGGPTGSKIFCAKQWGGAISNVFSVVHFCSTRTDKGQMDGA
jgi:hypothetical protein